jgi:hypothetical protein
MPTDSFGNDGRHFVRVGEAVFHSPSTDRTQPPSATTAAACIRIRGTRPIPASPIKTLRGVNGTKAFELLREKRVSMRFLARDRSNSRDERRGAVYPNDDCHLLSVRYPRAPHPDREGAALHRDARSGRQCPVCESGTDRIGRLSTRDYTTAEFPLPHRDSVPIGIITGADGNLWFTESAGHGIGRITLGRAITEFRLPKAIAGPNGIACGPDGNIWFAEADVDRVGRIAPQGEITECSAGITSVG